MAKKQVIWSGYAKKRLYAALELIIRENGDIKHAAAFFRSLSETIGLLLAHNAPFHATNMKDVYLVTVKDFMILFETREPGLIIHTITKQPG